MNTYDNLTLADIKTLYNVTSFEIEDGSSYNVFPVWSVENIEGTLRRMDMILNVLANAERPMRAGEIQEKCLPYNTSAIVAILTKLVACGMIKREEIEQPPIVIQKKGRNVAILPKYAYFSLNR